MAWWLTVDGTRSVAHLTAADLSRGSIVALELGFPMLENTGMVIATELARYLAQKGAGIICDDDNQWFEVREGGALEPLA